VFLEEIFMVKRLIQHGNSAALVIDKPIMEILNITNETSFELSTDGKNLILSPQVEYGQDRDIMVSLEKINKKYGSVLKRLGE
jgi:antitoxin component of MazEF toxin-antitoxin module